ncbi:MAG: hypothetical protein Q7V88_03550 [Actinomycetota bacterium]|nr:hypothetical protein [Actinomycetota bacterium]
MAFERQRWSYLVILVVVKTAVSVPDVTFRRADLVARRLGMSRSELYVRALEAYLGPPGDDELTARFDAVYSHDGVDSREPLSVDAEVVAAQVRAIGDTW